MDRRKFEKPEGIRPVKAAISLYGERIQGRKPDKYKTTQLPLKEDSHSITGELHRAKMDIGRLDESKNFAEKEKARAESELYRARSRAKELALQIEESDARARAWKLGLQSLRKAEFGDGRYAEVMRELDAAKKELSRLKLDVASALEAKAKAEKETEASRSKASSYSRSVEELRREIREANEEYVLVELARIEAEREFREIEARRVAEAARFAKKMEAAEKKIKDIREEIDHAEELEMKLEMTNSDVNVLQNEMELVRAMERKHQKNDLFEVMDKTMEEEPESRSLLRSAEAELEAARKELASIKEEGFQLMASMDLVREEMMHTAEETNRLKKLEMKADSTVQHLNSKLLKAKSKLESATRADERARAIVSNLSAALQQLQAEVESEKKEKEQVSEETKSIEMEIKKTDLDISSAEERLQAAVQELEAAKASEAVALKKLRRATERTIKARASSIQHSSTITISKCEYDYLNRRAADAHVVADKKVVAAQAWIEALKVGEKEILMKTELARRETEELKALVEKSLVAQETLEEEQYNCRQKENEADISNLQLVGATPRKSLRGNGIPAASRRAKVRRLSASSGMRYTRSPSFTVKKKRKVMPSLAKFLRGRKTGKQK
ncbi:protein PLASTID MOVEMENT IMPAIRED 2 [Phoenix dactylifera]|uniref:Protein PLASTID MOVEMENT IMPAIRED 2 n=1 Tax=Phoenix dactylifera TaxID=42345 RepID=A0A8B7CZW5_PHODC|nr:protein PLASTID MOVEMENT IMPAIRED 2 [Phoenix dactylifera]XP_026666015.2 protein PLASTID MOVEMENT IMPAIRED 2 [Phoenix dactylifera]